MMQSQSNVLPACFCIQLRTMIVRVSLTPVLPTGMSAHIARTHPVQGVIAWAQSDARLQQSAVMTTYCAEMQESLAQQSRVSTTVAQWHRASANFSKLVYSASGRAKKSGYGVAVRLMYAAFSPACSHMLRSTNKQDQQLELSSYISALPNTKHACTRQMSQAESSLDTWHAMLYKKKLVGYTCLAPAQSHGCTATSSTCRGNQTMSSSMVALVTN